MIPYSEIAFDTGGVILSVTGLLILLGQIYLTVSAFSVKRSVPLRLSAALQLSIGAVWFCLFLDGSFDPEYFERSRDFLPITEWMFGSPWIVVAGVEAVLAVILAVSLTTIDRYRRRNISQSAIKETVDMLPVGICFSKPDGTVVLKNLLADSLCYELTGSPLGDAKMFWQSVEKAGEKQDMASIVVLPSGKAMMCRKSKITVDGTPYDQYIAFDSTELYQMTSQLRDKNQKLLDIQARMKAFGDMAARLAMTEEILRARVSVHDEMGHLLLSGKYYLDHPSEGDKDNLLGLERYTHLLLMREGEEPNDALPDSIERAVSAAREMGVTVSVSGELPTGRNIFALIDRAIRECAANTVKHAKGDRLEVRISCEEADVRVTLTGNGEPPDGPIRESGGLLNLRLSIEAAGGTMEVSAEPRVTVTMSIPEE